MLSDDSAKFKLDKNSKHIPLDQVTKQMTVYAKRTKESKNATYDFIFVTDGSLEKDAEMNETVDKLDVADVSVHYLHGENPCKQLEDAIPESGEISLEAMLKIITRPRSNRLSTQWKVFFSPEKSIDVSMIKGPEIQKTSHPEVTVEMGTNNIVRKISRVYEDGDGMTIKNKELPKNVVLGDGEVIGTDSADKVANPTLPEIKELRILGFVENKIQTVPTSSGRQVFIAGKCAVFGSLYRQCKTRNKVILLGGGGATKSSSAGATLFYAVPLSNKPCFEIWMSANKNEVTENDEKQRQPKTEFNIPTHNYLKELPQMKVTDLIDPLETAIAQAYAEEHKGFEVFKSPFVKKLNLGQEAFGILQSHGFANSPVGETKSTQLSTNDINSKILAIRSNQPLKVTVAELKELCQFLDIKPKNRKNDIIEQIKASE